MSNNRTDFVEKLLKAAEYSRDNPTEDVFVIQKWSGECHWIHYPQTLNWGERDNELNRCLCILKDGELLKYIEFSLLHSICRKFNI